MGNAKTIILFHGRIKRRFKKPEKSPVKTGPFAAPNTGMPEMGDSARLTPIQRRKTRPLPCPSIEMPRLRVRFKTNAPEKVRRVFVPIAEPKKNPILSEENIVPKGHKIIWGYNSWSGECALGSASERMRDKWDYFYSATITQRSDLMREVQQAVAAAAVVLALILGAGPSIVYASMAVKPIEAGAVRAVDVYCEGVYMGMVPDEQSLQARLHDIEIELHDIYDMDVVVGSNLTYKPTVSSNLPAACLDETLDQVVAQLDVQVRASIITVDGEVYGHLRSHAEAQDILDRILEEGKSAVKSSASEVEVVGFAEDVQIEEGDIYYKELDNQDEVYESLTCMQDAQQDYTVQSGDSLWGIADMFAMSVDDLREMNPALGDRLSVGAQVLVHHADRVLDILTAETVTYDTEIPYQIIEEKRDNLYTTQSLLVRAGSSGVDRVTARVYRCNGVEQSREILAETVVSEPVDRVVAVGTMEPALYVDNSRGDGRYIWPAQGQLTSLFGTRWGRMHTGIDIANLKGTPIYAADSGTVIYSARKSGYGNLIIIYHGDGRETYYGHLSAYAASSGDAVEKGQLVGYMGSTGNSTGNHLHFEIRINGTPQNPLNYLD